MPSSRTDASARTIGRPGNRRLSTCLSERHANGRGTTHAGRHARAKHTWATEVATHGHHEHGGGKRWSQHVTDTSNALDLRKGVFELDDPAAIARSLKRSAEHSHRRKSDPYRSAMSMLTFYINRAGDNLSGRRRRILEDAKDELRALFDRPRQH